MNLWILTYFICFTLLQSLFLLTPFLHWLLGAPSNCLNFDPWELLHTDSCGFETCPQWTLIASLFSSITRYSGVIPAPERDSSIFPTPFQEKWYLEITLWALGVLIGLVIASRLCPRTELEIGILWKRISWIRYSHK